MRITDTTFRDGQQARPPYTVKQVAKMFDFLHRLGGKTGLITASEFFLYSAKDRKCIDVCRARGYRFPRVTAWIRATKDDLKLARDMSDTLAFYEATHGTAPTIAGKDKANPGSVILCGALMLEHIGVPKAAERIRNAVSKAIAAKAVTEDLAAQVPGSRTVGCVEFGDIIGANL